MTITLSDGITPIFPMMALGYQTERQSGNRVHVKGNSSIDVTLAPTGPRSGTLLLLFADEATSLVAENLLRTAKVFTIADTDRASYNMTFVLAEGSKLARQLDPATRSRFTLSIDFQETA
jgi:hypothetical protein